MVVPIHRVKRTKGQAMGGSAANKLNSFVRGMIKRFDPEKVILFGSQATGAAASGSDVDLLVVMDTPLKPIAQEVLIRKEIPRRFSLDLIVMKPRQLKRRMKIGDTFLRTVLSKGRVLYEKNNV